MTLNHKRMVAEFDASILPFNRKIDEMSSRTQRWRQESKVGFEEVDKGANRAALSLGKVFAATTALGGSAAVAAMLRFSDTAKQMGNQMRAIGAETEEAQRKIYALAIETRTPIESTVGLLRSMQKSLKDQDLETTMRQVATLNRLLTIGGLDGAARGSVALQFGQALQSGVLQGDELRSLREAAPAELLEAIAAAAGGTVEQLRDLGSQGKLTRDVMVQALADLEIEAQTKLGNFDLTLAEASDAMRTAFIAVSAEFNEGLTVTEKIAQAQQSVANFMLENAGAARVLGQALKTLTEVALVLAGTRGLLFLGPLIGTTAARFLALQRSVGVATVAMRGFTGALALLGGPWGAAIFAAGTALLVLSKNAKTSEERVKDLGEAIRGLETNADVISRAQHALVADGERLEKVNRRIEAAIEDQATAAEATARREAEAIQRRIDSNRELLAIQQQIRDEQKADAIEALADTRRSLARDARAILQQARISDPGTLLGEEGVLTPDWFASQPRQSGIFADNSASRMIADMTDDDALARVQEYLRTQERLSDHRLTFLKNLAAMIAEEERLTDTLSETREDAVDEAEAAAAEQAEADAALLAQYGENSAKLTALMEARGQAREALARAMERGDETEIGAYADALRQAEDELEKFQNSADGAKGRLDAMEESLDQLMALLDGPNGDFGSVELSAAGTMAETFQKRIDEAREGLVDLDAEDLNALQGAIAGLISMFDGIIARLGIVRERMGEGYAQAEIYGEYARTRLHSDRVTRARNETAAANSGILDLIGLAEGTDRGDGYNETLGYGAFTGGDRDLVNMTINEVMQMQGEMLAHPDNHYNSSAAGRYQIVRKTLRGLVGELGLTGNELYSPEMQDRLAMQLVRRRRGQGVAGYRNEWEGLRNVRDGSITTALQQGGIPRQDRAITERIEKETQARRDAADARREFAESAEEEAALRGQEIELIGKSASQQAYLMTKFELMNDAKRRGIKLDEQIAGSTRTYREEIERLSRAAEEDARVHGVRSAALETAEERTDFLDQANQRLKDGLIDAILEGENFADVLGNVAKMLAKAALEAALFGEGPFGGGGGGLLGGLFGGGDRGGGGGLLGGLFSFFGFAKGGVMTGKGPAPLRAYSGGGVANTPQTAVFGEGDMPEAYVPLPDGRTIPVTLDMPDLSRLAETPMVIQYEAQNAGPTEIVLRTAEGVTIEQVDTRARLIIRQEEGGIVEKSVSAVADGNRETKGLLG